MIESILDAHPDVTFLKADGFDNAVIGVDTGSSRLIYSVKKSIAILVAEGMDEEEAEEFFYYNVAGHTWERKRQSGATTLSANR